MNPRLQSLEHCDDCKQAVQHKGGPMCNNARMAKGEKKIRLCYACFFAYRGKYERNGWVYLGLTKTATL